MTTESRLREVTLAAVDALRQVVWDKQVTEDELRDAARFLNRIGQAGVFPSLLDIGFAMTIIDRAREGIKGTRPNLEGPEYVPGAPERTDGSLLEHEPGPDAKLFTLSGRVTDADSGEPLRDVELDFWHADEHGGYDRNGYHLRGVVHTTADGTYRVRTLLPKDYAEHEGDPIGELLEKMGLENYRAAHIHLKVRVDGKPRLTTQVFRSDSPYLDSDYVIGAVSDDLVLELRKTETIDGHDHYESVFNIALGAK